VVLLFVLFTFSLGTKAYEKISNILANTRILNWWRKEAITKDPDQLPGKLPATFNHWHPKMLRLRAVPLFSYSPSTAERKKQTARKLVSGRKAKKKGLQTKPQGLTFHGRAILWYSFQILLTAIQLFPLSWRPVNFGLSSLSSLSSISKSHFCVVGATHKSNAEALSVVPFFSPFAQTRAFARPTLARPVFFAPLSTDYKKTKGLLVV